MPSQFIPQEIIRKKRDGNKLSDEELNWFFGEYLKNNITDYQASAMLMAMFLNGMDHAETVTLTKANRDSGEVMKWPYDKNMVVDKHSTGGIGDKTSMILLPLCALEGLKIPMISGRGLGHTGGTLDKLESIPGMNVRPSTELARKIIDQLGGAFMGQSAEIATLDRRLYALRDVTATVESIPLIVASILSKKLAEGLGGLVLDVKFGSGAFMSKESDARSLAKDLVTVASECGLKCKALLTSMNNPLGTYAGNGLEMLECFDVLKGQGPKDTRDLSLSLASEMVQIAFPERDFKEIETTLAAHLSSGRAMERFCKIIAAQGGDTSVIENTEHFPVASEKLAVASTTSGFVSSIDVRGLGLAIVKLGGGRLQIEDKIDPTVGLSELLKIGDRVETDAPVATVHTNNLALGKEAVALVQSCYQISPDKPAASPLIIDRIVAD